MGRYQAKKILCGQNIRYLSSGRRCIMGCPAGRTLHLIPKDPIKRAEWFQILGISSKKKYIYLCGAHFPPNYTYGKRRNPHVLPKPREKPATNNTPILKGNYTSFLPQYRTLIPKSSRLFDEIQNPTVNPEVFELRDLDNEYHASDELQNETVIPEEFELRDHNNESHESDELQNQFVKPEVFELRDPNNGSPIIIGCYYQSNDFLMTSYTQTNKLSHQQQVFLLNYKYEEQLRVLDRLKRENYRLTKAVRRHQILFSQLRKIKTKNGMLRKNIRKLKVITRKLEKRARKANIVEKNNINS